MIGRDGTDLDSFGSEPGGLMRADQIPDRIIDGDVEWNRKGRRDDDNNFC